MSILSDRYGYRVLNRDPTDVFRSELTSILQSGFDNHLIDQKELDFLLPTHPRVATFYGLPKVLNPLKC